jgi:uncharacterized protein (DUF1800 family)
MTRIIAVTLLLWAAVILPASATDPKILHAISRLSFGSTPREIERVESIGVDRYIQEQLNPATISPSTSLSNKLASLSTVSMTTTELGSIYGAIRKTPAVEPTNMVMIIDIKKVVEERNQAKLLRAIESPRQLEEVMTDFWYNHFNVSSSKGISRVWVGNYEQTAIRPYAFGKFRDLLGATARHPAMLHYLDNWQNTTPNPNLKARNRGGINENYARELMELHTLGVKGGYTQKDVTNLAQIFTGWGYLPANTKKGTPFTFFFNPNRHDSSPKTLLGKPITSSGEQEVEQALDMLAKNPATAKFISYKIAQRFVSDNPPAALVDRMKNRWLQTDGDIKAVMTTMLNSKEFWAPAAQRSKFKTPLEYVVSAARATGSNIEETKYLNGQLSGLGMPLYGCLTPDGYKNTREAWLNENSTIQRINFASHLASGRGLSSKPQPIDILKLDRAIGPYLSVNTKTTITASKVSLQSALMLGSPDFMYR